ncbi:secreted protein [Nemania abortiva]|nr:secreted protein [Nemania abortiva]
MSQSMRVLGAGIATLALFTNATAASPDAKHIFKRDPPTALPGCATDAVMDFDIDGCYNSPAIDADGNLATGLDCGGAKDGNCRGLSDLQNNNVYSRARCNNGWYGFLYGYYFEKDQTVDGGCGVVRFQDTHAKVIYHQEGSFTNDFYFANEDDDNIENHTKEWFPSTDLHDAMLNTDWGKALPDIGEDVYPGGLGSSRGGNDVPTDTSVDGENSPGQPIC